MCALVFIGRTRTKGFSLFCPSHTALVISNRDNNLKTKQSTSRSYLFQRIFRSKLFVHWVGILVSCCRLCFEDQFSTPKDEIGGKKRSRRSIMKGIRSGDYTRKRTRWNNSKRKRDDPPSSSIHESIKFAHSEAASSVGNVGNDFDFYKITHIQSLVSFTKQLLCPDCKCLWNGFVSLKERSELYVQLEFVYDNCASVVRLRSSAEISDGSRHEINVRLALVSPLSGLGPAGVMKLLGSLNLPPPVQETKNIVKDKNSF